ncbi:G-protein coupled adenosine receptor activity protein [Homalodisca vitripennis]|nr:G-protein coupled adenosine receptor activity protein [Homalodisca vitripennis]
MSPQFLISYTSNSSFCPAVFPVTGIICVCWVAGGIVGFLPLFGWNNVQGEISSCFFEEVMSPQFLVFLYFATIIGPATVMAAFYTHIYTVVLKQVSTILFQTPILKRVLEHCWKIKNPPEFSEFDRNLKKKLASQSWHNTSTAAWHGSLQLQRRISLATSLSPRWLLQGHAPNRLLPQLHSLVAPTVVD